MTGLRFAQERDGHRGSEHGSANEDEEERDIHARSVSYLDLVSLNVLPD